MDSSEAITKVFRDTKVRIIGGDSPTMVLKDVADALGYRTSNLKRAIKDRHCVPQKVTDAAGRYQEMICSTLPGLSQAIRDLEPRDEEKSEAVDSFEDFLWVDVIFPGVGQGGRDESPGDEPLDSQEVNGESQAITEVFRDTEIRIVDEEPPTVVLKDVADALGYRDAHRIKRTIKDKYLVTHTVGDVAGRDQKMICVTRPGLSQALATLTPQDEEKHKVLETFQDWLYEDLLESVYNNGSWEAGDDGGEDKGGSDPDSLASEAASLRQRFEELKDEVRERQRELDEAKAELLQFLPGDTQPDEQELQLPGQSAPAEMADADRLDEPDTHQLVVEEPSSDTVPDFQLRRPLVLFDLETTGLDTDSAMITEIAMYRLVPGEEGPDADGSILTFVDPGESIPEKVTEVTGITDEDVRGQPTFETLMPAIAGMVKDADLMGYNAAEFDVPLLRSMFQRHGSEMPAPDDQRILDPLRLERRLRSNKLGAVYRRYTGEDLENAHEADADIRATWTVLQYQLKGLPLGGEVGVKEVANCAQGDFLDDQHKFRKDGDSVLVCFGKHKGKALGKVAHEDPGYVDWMLEQDELRPYVKNALDF